MTVLYRDGSLAVCLKPPGVSSETDMPRLLSEELGGQYRCVHRLDAAVGGVMVYAAAAGAAAALSRSMTEGRFEKTYLALCAGTLDTPEGELRDLLFRDAARNKSFVVSRPRKGVREAALYYRVLDTREGISLLRIRLETGRSHQIRVQLASRRHPLLGDGKYGSRVKCPLALWSQAIAFPHPETGGTLRFSAPPPEAWPWTRFDASFFNKE